MLKRNAGLRQRLIYWFDNVMAQGMWAKIELLLIVTLVFVVSIGLLVFAVDPEKTAQEGIWTTLLMVLGKGIKGDITEHGLLNALLMLLVVFYAMFFMATLIGLINGGLRAKIDDLARGKGTVLEDGHTIILGYNEATFVLLDELINAQSNIYHPQSVVVLDEIDQLEMENAFRSKFGNAWEHPKTKIICRTGSIYNLDDLRRCSLETSRAVIINADTDFETTKVIMACSTILGEQPPEFDPYAIAVIQEERNMGSAKIAEGKRKVGNWLELLALQGVLARIMVHTSRQPGLSEVFTELFNFAKNEFYIVGRDISFEFLAGKNIFEINRFLKNSIAVGIVNDEGEVVIGEPKETVFNEGDSLIVIKEEDNPLRVLQDAYPVIEQEARPRPQQGATRILILGENVLVEDILLEYAHYLKPGSTLCIASNREGVGHSISQSTKAVLENAQIGLKTVNRFTGRGKVFERILSDFSPESIVVLADRNTTSPEDDDERIMKLLLQLREYREKHHAYYSITSEMNRSHNRELAAATGPDDFIIGQHISALIMSQVSYNRHMRKLFDSLLSHEGFEVYMKSASWYIPLDEPVDLFAVGEAVAQQGEVFVGIRKYDGNRYADAIVNPPKYEEDMLRIKEYTFSEKDYFVVLSDSMD